MRQIVTSLTDPESSELLESGDVDAEFLQAPPTSCLLLAAYLLTSYCYTCPLLLAAHLSSHKLFAYTLTYVVRTPLPFYRTATTHLSPRTYVRTHVTSSLPYVLPSSLQDGHHSPFTTLTTYVRTYLTDCRTTTASRTTLTPTSDLPHPEGTSAVDDCFLTDNG